MKRIASLLVAFTLVATSQESRPVSSTVHDAYGHRSRPSLRADAPPPDDTMKVYRLPEILVTATRYEKKTAEVGRSISIISKEQATNSLYGSVGEAIAQHEGIYIVGLGQNPGMIQSIFMRGAANNQTTLLIDDVRITDPSSVNNALDLSELSFSGLDRIEIVRGSHSTLYGSSAIGGVVNMITEKNRKPGLHLDVEGRLGTFGKGTSALSQNLFLNYTSPGGFYTSMELDNARIHGLDATFDAPQVVKPFGGRDADGLRKRDVFGKVGFRDEMIDAYLSYKNTARKTDLDKTTYTDDDNFTLDFQRDLFTYGTRYKMSDEVSFKYVGGYTRMRRSAIDDSSVVDNIGTTDHTYSEGRWSGTMMTNELQGTVRLAGIEGVVGVGSQKETMGSTSYFFTRSAWGVFELSTDLESLGLKASTTSFYSHVDLNGSLLHLSLAGLDLGLGFRVDKHNAFGTSATYEVNPSWRIGDTGLVFASYSTGLNAPSLYQLYSPDQDMISGVTRGNKTLQPERSESYEFGFKQSLGSMDVSVSFFSTTVENSIEYVYLWDKSIGLDTLGNSWMRNDFRGDTYVNVGEQRTRGIELTLNARVTEKLWLSGNYSLVSGRLRFAPEEPHGVQTAGHRVQVYSNGAFLTRAVESGDLVRRPNTANLSLRYTPLAIILLRLDVRHVGSRPDIYFDSERGPYGALGTSPVDAYTLVDFSQSFVLSENLTINGRIENLLDKKYLEINGYTTRGRGFYVSVRYSLGQGL